MRNTFDFDEQMKFGEVDISAIMFDPRCRDEIPQLLLGLQFIYVRKTEREEIFAILEEEVVAEGVSTSTGRPGMSLWQILVLAMLRVNCNWDWDKVMYMANTHGQIRQMMGIGEWDDKKFFSLQTIKDNVALLKPETLNKINTLIVKAGHELVKKNGADELIGKCDSFVLETDVHYPTDINLLLDAMRKVIYLVAALCLDAGVAGWRKSNFNFAKIKKLYRKCQKMKHSTSRNEKLKKMREALIIEAYEAYLELARLFLSRVRETLEVISEMDMKYMLQIVEIEHFMAHAERQIDQVERRGVNDETIPHDEKVFSIFEEHTEWISKGKAGVPVELGLKVCIMEDQHGFILHHMVMEKKMDVAVAVTMVENAQAYFPQFNGCSYDKGFWSPENQKTLDGILDHLVLPKKGNLSVDDKEREHSDEFIYYRRKHSAVESGINALENHGLDRCSDHGLFGFKRYVAVAVLGRNCQKIGAILQARELKKMKRKKASDSGGLKKTA